MAAIVTHVDDLHKTEEDRNVPADESIVLGVDGIDYDIDLTTENAAVLRKFLARYTAAGTPHSSQQLKKRPPHGAVTGETPLKRARKHRERMRAFADSRPDLGEKSYLTENGNYSYTERLETAYGIYVAEHGEYPLPGEPGSPR
jgi:Lsr2 protein